MADRSTSGRFITFEGIDGAGKSTQGRRLARWLEQHGVSVCLTREPGGSPGAEHIRNLLVTGPSDRWDPWCEALLLYAARRDHWIRLIEPALARGQWVICDRFTDSTFVYQGVAGGMCMALLQRLHDLALGPVRPDVTVLLDLPVLRGLERVRDRAAGEDRFENRSRDYLDRLRMGFLDRARAEPDRIAVIDASAAPGEIAIAVVAELRARLSVDSASWPTTAP